MLKQLNAPLLLMTAHTAHRSSPHLSPPQRPPPCRCSSGAAACAKLEKRSSCCKAMPTPHVTAKGMNSTGIQFSILKIPLIILVHRQVPVSGSVLIEWWGGTVGLKRVSPLLATRLQRGMYSAAAANSAAPWWRVRRVCTGNWCAIWRIIISKHRPSRVGASGDEPGSAVDSEEVQPPCGLRKHQTHVP